MSNENLKSLERTASFLRDARFHISPAGRSIYEDEIDEFDEHLEQNEFELALDKLDVVIGDSYYELPQMIEFMAKAALSMGLAERTKNYDKRLSDWRGWEFHTTIE